MRKDDSSDDLSEEPVEELLGEPVGEPLELDKERLIKCRCLFCCGVVVTVIFCLLTEYYYRIVFTDY